MIGFLVTKFEKSLRRKKSGLSSIVVGILLLVLYPQLAQAMICKDLFSMSPLEQLSSTHRSDLTGPDYVRYAELNNMTETVFTPSYGWLKGIPVRIPVVVLAKLRLKHKFDLNHVQKVFSIWRDGPVLQESPEGTWSDSVRYSFTVVIPRKKTSLQWPQPLASYDVSKHSYFIRVILDLAADDNLYLISMHYVKPSVYTEYLDSQKELE